MTSLLPLATARRPYPARQPSPVGTRPSTSATTRRGQGKGGPRHNLVVLNNHLDKAKASKEEINMRKEKWREWVNRQSDNIRNKLKHDSSVKINCNDCSKAFNRRTIERHCLTLCKLRDDKCKMKTWLEMPIDMLNNI